MKNIIVNMIGNEEITLGATTKDLLSNDKFTAALDSLVQPKPQVTTNVFDIPQQ